MLKLLRRLSGADEQVESVSLAEELFQFPVAKVPPGVAPTTLHEYTQLAEKLGFRPVELVRARMLDYFSQSGVGLYDYHEVSTWLTHKRREAGVARWCWRAFRNKDRVSYEWGISGGEVDGYYAGHWANCRPYELLVPAEVLRTVERIEKRFGDEVKFFVSDFAVARPDPFMMVRPAQSNPGSVADYNLVFAVWDEPGFGK